LWLKGKNLGRVPVRMIIYPRSDFSHDCFDMRLWAYPDDSLWIHGPDKAVENYYCPADVPKP
jgi:hypothetical protein